MDPKPQWHQKLFGLQKQKEAVPEPVEEEKEEEEEEEEHPPTNLDVHEALDTLMEFMLSRVSTHTHTHTHTHAHTKRERERERERNACTHTCKL